MLPLFAINAVLILGYAFLTLYPEFLARLAWAPSLLAVSQPLLIRIQILVGFWFCMRACQKAMGFRWFLFLAVTVVVSLLTEFWGTIFGIPFGTYTYTRLLGWQIAGKVPMLIPISWFCLSVGSYVLAMQLLGPASMQIFTRTTNHWYRSAQRVGLAVCLLIAWGIMLEPMMARLTPYWVWQESPAHVFPAEVRNLMTWSLTGLFIFFGFEFLRLRDEVHRFERFWALKFYGISLSLPFGLAVVAGAWAPIILSMALLLGCYMFSRKKGVIKRGRFGASSR